jgi:hypothetical protein
MSNTRTTPSALPLWISIALASLAIASASRAYPHGCLYRHASYYTYDERDDISWTAAEDVYNMNAVNGNSNAEEYSDFRVLPSKSSTLRRPYERYRLTRRLGSGKFSDVFEAVDVEWEKKCIDGGVNSRVDTKRMSRLRVGQSSSLGEGDVTDTDATDGSTTELEDEKEGVEDVESLVVLKVSVLLLRRCICTLLVLRKKLIRI